MNGLVHIYCGDGKGKTTAAVGLGIRACGSGKRVLMVQFLKGTTSGELNVLRDLKDFHILPSLDRIKFTFQMTKQELEETAALCAGQFHRAASAVHAGEYDVFILDEVFGAVNCGLLDKSLLIDLIKNKPQNLELVLTGRDPEPEVLELADYVSEIRKIKHPYDRGIPARKGIEF
ncbi:cob(I)yrinic acid a,c-diamide adenosyltransferase [Caproiciproducens galactitolivorans]|uniref:Cob(I)yrinic acid a,c-diamide adenosyltransferase n=1 Tax=Caproiciproducens galactitolivorans TaxID=642589 RepID=A0A4Z0Y8R6_9FIRM|nr:cob(I)yrinic acid a,c-diamide adenosyltransferase [Caproiciproducens galactitolivorans]QEY34965.1 cob(I)yrinic acid a,c-diamide adenosyltransferase [Caproiciproducens galactitolivorans]TGJ76328.1 Cob(I)yrinic acid a,c-diamide adenosyltransferase [Caproiciproducens galactitolivorans]